MLGAVLGVDSLIAKSADLTHQPGMAGFGDLHEALRHEKRIGAWRYAYVHWSSEPGRGRIYLHLFDETGSDVAFVKAVQARDSCDLERERAALGRLAGGSDETFRAPSVLSADTGIESGFAWLAMEPMPRGIKPHPSDASDSASYVSRFLLEQQSTVSTEELERLPWWRSMLQVAPTEFVEDLLEFVGNEAQVGRVHGDFGAHNLADARGTLWVFDWESSSPDGPAATDVWSVEFLTAHPAEVLRRLWGTNRTAFGDAMLTVAYQAGLDIRQGPETVRQWRSIRKDIGL